MPPKKRPSVVALKSVKATPIKKTAKKTSNSSRRGTPSSKASPAPPGDHLHELRFYPWDTPWKPHPEPEKRKLCPPCWLAKSKGWGLAGPGLREASGCDRIPCRSCKRKGFGTDVCSGCVGEDGRDPWEKLEDEVIKQDEDVRHAMVWSR